MSFDFSEADYKRVKNGVVKMRETGHPSNSFQYFFAFNLKEVDPKVSTAMAKKYLPRVAAESPLEDEIIVKKVTPRKDDPSTWIVDLKE